MTCQNKYFYNLYILFMYNLLILLIFVHPLVAVIPHGVTIKERKFQEY